MSFDDRAEMEHNSASDSNAGAPDARVRELESMPLHEFLTHCAKEYVLDDETYLVLCSRFQKLEEALFE